jgi:hypothetical protein
MIELRARRVWSADLLHRESRPLLAVNGDRWPDAALPAASAALTCGDDGLGEAEKGRLGWWPLLRSMRCRRMPFQQVGPQLVFLRHALQFFSCVGVGRYRSLPTALQFKRTVRIIRRAMHRT